MAYGGNQGNIRNRGTTVQTKIELVVGTIMASQTEYECKIEVRTVKGINVVSEEVRVKKGTQEIDKQRTDVNGEWLYVHKEPLSEAGKSVSLKFQIVGKAIETTATLILPVVATTAGKDDPQVFETWTDRDGNGNFTLVNRVVKEDGCGVIAPITITFDGEITSEDTDANGYLLWEVPVILAAGETKELIVSVKGILAKNRVTISQPKDRITERLNFFQWLFLVNNGRAVLSLGLMLCLWLICVAIGIGDPMFVDKTNLSTQQEMYNQIVANVDPSSAYVPEVSKGDWQKYIWFFVFFLWTPFALIYAPLSLREELVEAIREVFNKIKTKHMSRASDPWIERLFHRLGVYSIARREPVSTTTSPSTENTTPKSEKRDISFWKLLKSDLLSDILVEVLPGLLKIFKR